MRMLGLQIASLREKADMLDGLEGMDNLVPMLREAADTIERLRKQVAKCQIAELKADYDTSRYFELFGTPERAARTLARMDVDACNWCVNSSGNPKDCRSCPYEYDYYGCYLPEKFSMLEWLRGDAS